MKHLKLLTFVVILSLGVASAAVDPFVLIRGTVGGSFNDKEVSVKDSFGQSYILPRSVFPKDFVPESGKAFTVEVPEGIIKSLKVAPPQKKK